MSSYTLHHEKSLAEIVTDIKDEMLSFIQTRVQLLVSELRDGAAQVKAALPMVAVGAVLLATAYLLLTLALVAGIAIIFWNTPYVWLASFGIAGILWLVLGTVVIYMGVKRLRPRDLVPRKTMEVLQADKLWAQSVGRHLV